MDATFWPADGVAKEGDYFYYTQAGLAATLIEAGFRVGGTGETGSRSLPPMHERGHVWAVGHRRNVMQGDGHRRNVMQRDADGGEGPRPTEGVGTAHRLFSTAELTALREVTRHPTQYYERYEQIER